MNRAICASCFIVDFKTKELLLIYNRKLGKWLQPGGHIEGQETPLQAEKREVKEETGIEFTPIGEKFQNNIEPFAVENYITRIGPMIDIQFIGIPESKEIVDKEDNKARWIKLKEIEYANNIDDEIKEKFNYILNKYKSNKMKNVGGKMKFIQVSDVHFDIPFRKISDRADLGEERRLEQRKAFREVINLAKETKVEYLFICGDLYEHEYIRKSTIDFLNNLFKEIPSTKIYMVPGNHDPIINNSYYRLYEWADNVKIFSNDVEKIEDDEVVIYGYGFNNFEMNENQINNIQLTNQDKINILLTHGDLYNMSTYNPISLNKLKNVGFDYVGIGHLHKRDEYYAGSLISLGFDEPGEHGFLYGEIKKENGKCIINKKFIKADERELIKLDYDVSEISSEEELIENLNLIKTENNLYEINLIGYRNFYINLNIRLIQKNIIKIKNNTKIKIDLNTKENEKTLTGFFIKELNDKLKNDEINERQYEEILELQNIVMGK